MSVRVGYRSRWCPRAEVVVKEDKEGKEVRGGSKSTEQETEQAEEVGRGG